MTHADRLIFETQVTDIKDTTQLELLEIVSTGSLGSGEKSLADLRKRKLVIQKYDQEALVLCSTDTSSGKANGSLSEKAPILARRQPNRKPISQLTC